MKVRLYGAAVFVASFLLVFRGVNNSAPLTEGWWHVYVRWLNQGKVPYRDFELLVPPGYPYLLRAAVAVVGEGFYALRIVGAIQLGAIALCTFYLVLRFVSPAIGGLIAVSTTMFLTSSTAFVSYDYVYTALLFMLATFSYGLRLESSFESVKPENAWKWILVGSLASGASMVKQTQGIWTLAALAALLILFNSANLRVMLLKIGLVTLGIGAVWVPTLAWFAAHDVSPIEFGRAIFVIDGPKGSVTEIFFSWIQDIFRFYGENGVRATAASALTILQVLAPWLGVSLLLRRFPDRQSSSRFHHWIAISGVFTVAVVSLFISWNRLGVIGDVLRFFEEQVRINVYVGSWLALILCCLWVVSSLSERQALTDVLAATGIVIAVVWACAMSAGITEIGVFLAVAMALAAFIFVSRVHWASITLVGLLATSMLSGSWWTKQLVPYAWWGYQTPAVADATTQLEDGLFSGLATSPVVRSAYDQTVDFVKASASCDGEVVAYPHVPVFLLDAGLMPGGRLAQYWFDFSSETEIRAEVERLQSRQLSAVVILRLPDSVIESHETLFNEGRPLAQRALASFIDSRVVNMVQVMSTQISAEARLDTYVSQCVVDSRGM